MRIAFDKELARGVEAYEDLLGRWWFDQSSSAAHRRAYRRVADYIAASFRDSPGIIADYACGAGNLLCRLATRFPHSRLIGLDGSSYLLALARRKLARLGESALARVFLVRTVLPKFDLRIRANLVLFTFPNMVPGSPTVPRGQVESRLAPEDLARELEAAQPVPPLPDPLPAALREKYGLIGLTSALRAIHWPLSEQEKEAATDFETVSVVMMALARSCPPSVERAIWRMPVRILSMGKSCPVTPVLATNTSSVLQPRA
jgi:hypothetical protein